jgi:hypothetical protein
MYWFCLLKMGHLLPDVRVIGSIPFYAKQPGEDPAGKPPISLKSHAVDEVYLF